MSSKMEEKFSEIKEHLKKMGDLAIEAISKGCESFEKLDQDLAAKVISADTEMDVLDDKIETLSVRAIARFQPVAADIRKISVYLKVITDLRRIGRYGYDMAMLTQRMKGLTHFKKLIKIPEMGRMALRMTETALDALFDDKAKSPLKQLFEDDELADAMMEELFRELVTYTSEDPGRFTVAMYYLLAGRYLERAEDHAVSIGYYAHYMKTGQRGLNQEIRSKK
ncbi:MAG: phosphate signaling complex protein PhoU [Candidatus Odinarchaeota archaeon]